MKIQVRAILIASVVFLFMSTTVVAKIRPQPSWTWTKDNPKPTWWTWGTDYWPEKPVRGGYLKLASFQYIGLMNPNHWPVNDWTAMTKIHDLLVYNDGNYKSNIFWLAESIEYKNPTTIVMKLRKGVQFHDGADFNAAGVKYQWEWIMDRKNGAWTRSWIEPIKSIEIVDEYTVQINTKRIWAGFTGMMATTPGYMISPEALKKDVALKELGSLQKKLAAAKKKVGKMQAKVDKATGSAAKKAEKTLKKTRGKLAKIKKELAKMEALTVDAVPLDQHAVGAGKYMVEAARPGNYLKLKRNPNWWFGRSIGRPGMPYPDGLLFTVIPDSSVQLANLRAGKIHVMGVLKSQHALLKNDRNVTMDKSYWPHVSAMKFNTTQGPCKDIRVRKAISHAIDRRALIMGIQFGSATPAAGMFPTKHWASNPALKPVEYDPELSKKLLAEAGYADGLEIRGYTLNLAESVSTAEAVKNMLSKVGVDWKFDQLSAAGVDGREKNLEFDMAQGGWIYIWDPDLMCVGLYHADGSHNFGRSDNKAIMALIEKGKKEIDFAKRRRIYQDLEKVVYDDYQDAWLWYPTNFTAHSQKVAGYNEKLLYDGLEGFYHSHPLWLRDGGRKR